MLIDSESISQGYHELYSKCLNTVIEHICDNPLIIMLRYITIG